MLRKAWPLEPSKAAKSPRPLARAELEASMLQRLILQEKLDETHVNKKTNKTASYNLGHGMTC